MCSSTKTKLLQRSKSDISPAAAALMNGRPVLQPNSCNRVPLLERRIYHSLKKPSPTAITILPPQPLSSSSSSSSPSPSISASTTSDVVNNNIKSSTRPNNSATTPPASPCNLKSPRQPAVKRSSGNDPNASLEKEKPKSPATSTKSLVLKKSKNLTTDDSSSSSTYSSLKYSCSSSLIVEAPGSIAAARREQMAIMQEQRKMRIAHYGRTKSAKFETKVAAVTDHDTNCVRDRDDKRCSFITPYSDPIYVAYHDDEWGVPVHDDKLLFELLVLTGAQVGTDWTSVLKKRQDFRDAFCGFDAETVAQYSEKKITSIAADYGIELSQVRGIVDNSKRILEIKKEMGSLDKYLWGFVNYKAISTQYKWSQKIPVKTSKSETISKGMVRRGFRLVGPTVIHSFMQAAGLTNDHLITCPRHLQCAAAAAVPPQ